MSTFDEAIAAGYDETQAKAIENIVAQRSEESTVIYNYPAWRPGKFSAAQGGDFEVTDDDVVCMAEAVNKLYALGHPVSLIDGHGTGTAIGVMPAAKVADGKMMAAIVVPWWAAEGIKQGLYGLSVEADRDYSSDAYTDGKEYRYWPTAWAMLPAGEQPAIPPGEPLAAAEETKKPVRLYAHETAPSGGESPDERGRGTMTPEEMKAEMEKIKAAQGAADAKTSELEATIADLTTKLAVANEELAKLKGEKEAVEVEAAEKAVEDRTKILLASEQRPGIREKISGKLAAAEGHKAKAVLLDAFESMIDETELVAARLHASEAKPEKGDDGDKYIKAAEARAKKDGIKFAEALSLVVAEEQEG